MRVVSIDVGRSGGDVTVATVVRVIRGIEGVVVIVDDVVALPALPALPDFDLEEASLALYDWKRERNAAACKRRPMAVLKSSQLAPRTSVRQRRHGAFVRHRR